MCTIQSVTHGHCNKQIFSRPVYHRTLDSNYLETEAHACQQLIPSSDLPCSLCDIFFLPFLRRIYHHRLHYNCKCKCNRRFIERDYVTPLMRYRLECPANRYVFKSRLNCTESTAGSLRQSGNEFQTVDPATEKARSQRCRVERHYHCFDYYYDDDDNDDYNNNNNNNNPIVTRQMPVSQIRRRGGCSLRVDR